MIIYTFFFCYCLYLTLDTKIYLNKYKPSAVFFKRMADLCVTVTGIFSQRDMRYAVQTNTSFIWLKNRTNFNYSLNE